MIKISPSILAADFSDLKSEIKKIEAAGADMVHIDVMDGLFVPNISFGLPVIKAIRHCTNLLFDVHLMIKSPERYINDFKEAPGRTLSPFMRRRQITFTERSRALRPPVRRQALR